MKFKAEFYTMHLNMGAYEKAMLKALRKYNERAGRAWIHTAVDMTPIPTWSGASRATFQKLASELGTSVPIGSLRTKSRVSLGRSTSAGSGIIENKSYVGFQYSTNLRYLAYNEYNAARAGTPPAPFSNNVRFTPYGFQDRARSAWEDVAKTAELLNPYKYLNKRKI
jgi:hypothetical protein